MDADALEIATALEQLTKEELQLLIDFCEMLAGDHAFSEAYKALVDKSGVPLADDLREFMDKWEDTKNAEIAHGPQE